MFIVRNGEVEEGKRLCGWMKRSRGEMMVGLSRVEGIGLFDFGWIFS